MRILIAGHEIGGQMQLMAETMRAKGYDAKSAAFNSDFRQFNNDYQPKRQKIPIQRFLFSAKAICHYDVFHFFWGVSLFDFWKFYSLDLPLLRKLNKKIVVHFRGTDLVDIDYYKYLNDLANGVQNAKPAMSRPDQKQKLERWRKYAHRLLVSTPDLLEIVPEATLFQQVVDVNALGKWSGREKKNTLFRVAHAPTRRNTKGTHAIIRAVETLRQKSVPIELDLIENQSPEEVLRRFSDCDVGIDQLLSGWYGKAGVELMAMGKPMLCYIDPRFENFRPDLPVIGVTKATLEKTLLALTESSDELRFIGKESMLFAAKYHDVDTLVDELLALYSTL